MATLHFHTEFDSPVGPITFQGDGTHLTGLHFPSHRHWPGVPESSQRSDDLFHEARRQLSEYFQGTRQSFDLPLRATGTPFQQRVWDELLRIPFGETRSYAELARRVGNPAATRAVGAANGRNPISIIIPCHRVIATSGVLTGYGGGLERKRQLLALEQHLPPARSSGQRVLFEVTAGRSAPVAGG